MLSISRTSFFGLLAGGRVGPRPIRFSRRCIRWHRDDVIRWCAAGCPPRARWGQEDTP
jgi:predicted DNA-binding transcriptional regulator AlpA